MTTTCLKCDGEGELECEHCNQPRECPDCYGEGEIECSIADWEVPENHKNRDDLLEIQYDARKCEFDHAKLVKLNPQAKISYDFQLRKTLEKLNQQAESLFDTI